MAVKIAFADLTYTNQGYSSLSFPLGISFVASYAKKILKEKINAEIFKYPEDLIEFLDKNEPKIIGFTNYSWTLDLSHEFAKRIKEKYKDTIVVFGGPNFPIDKEEQKKFLEDYPFIDFYIRGEGEKAFVELFINLENANFNLEEFKKKAIRSSNCYYLHDKNLIAGEIMPRIESLDEVPSPYLSGLMDKFFDGILIPNFQTTRGCPFSCAYCQEGQNYFNKISRFSPERIEQELDYIASRVKVPNLIISDSNFCMYDPDKKTCEIISKLKEKYNWPKYFEVSLGKDKQKVLNNISILKGDIVLSAPVQSTDDEVLSNIKRKNISMNQLIDITKAGGEYGASSFSEIILALPGDSLKKHYKSVFDMIDAGIDVVRSHQLLILPGAEISTDEFRKKFEIKTKFRIQPKCFGNYSLFGKTFSAAEIDEICIENSSLTLPEYLKCRKLDLTVEIFYNNGVFEELISFLKQNGISASLFINNINNIASEIKLKSFYDEFSKETENSLWTFKEDLKGNIKNPEMIEKYIKENIRNNEQLKYRAIGFFMRIDEMHAIAFDAAIGLLKDNNKFDEKTKLYLEELYQFSIARKKNLLLLDETPVIKFHFDFIKLLEKKFIENPFNFFIAEGINIRFFHSEDQKELIKKYTQQFGTSMNGLGLILSRSRADKFYRKAEAV